MNALTIAVAVFGAACVLLLLLGGSAARIGSGVVVRVLTAAGTGVAGYGAADGKPGAVAGGVIVILAGVGLLRWMRKGG